MSEWQFSKKYTLPSDEEFNERKQDASQYARSLAYRYRPTRKYRSKGTSLKDEEDSVQNTLLEYGHKAYRSVRQESVSGPFGLVFSDLLLTSCSPSKRAPSTAKQRS